ncbi:anaerobic sulfite reductase subunit AsrA [Clostridium thermobutyricum]|uniref:anaerobic sulfite reductase subunit AsrA n=1 Tax=Clostridium thermobutyricum TaxID=29372 RepID=UPI0029425CA4|nr:anaerobic sulfite reductase subunit AsrA [Clostridium thermobutyricum]
MGIKLRKEDVDSLIRSISPKVKVFAPKVFEGKGRFSETDMIRYGEIKDLSEIVFDKKSDFSSKEIITPITQTLFFFTEDEFKEAKGEDFTPVIILRSCDMHAIKRFDDIYLRNGFEDIYYKRVREKAKFIVIGCPNSFENCFCVSMGTNETDSYDAYLKVDEDFVYLDVKDKDIEEIVSSLQKMDCEVMPEFVKENTIKVDIPENIDTRIFKSTMWNEYTERCIACGRCNFVCPTCTCYTMQDIFYKDNKNAGERRRVWASCQVQGYTTMAGGHEFRKPNGDKMRFKVMHKVYDYKKRWGYHMCTGCGRCDDICPQYISMPGAVNKLRKAMDEVTSNE